MQIEDPNVLRAMPTLGAFEFTYTTPNGTPKKEVFLSSVSLSN